MQVKSDKVSETKLKLTLTADEKVLAPLKDAAVARLGKNVKLPGFRSGKAPQHLIEKNLDDQILQSEVLQEAMDQMYRHALQSENIRPVDAPKATLKKFVPYTSLEFEAEVEVFGTVKLPNYKKIKKTKPEVNVTEKDITAVIDNLKTRMSEKKDVTREAKDGDQVVIDFTGVDDKKQPIKGADGKDYPLILGSDTFIPGFEKNLVGLKNGEVKTFTLTFPKDYGVKALANKKVTFTATVTKVQEVVEPKVDDAFAAKVGPFKTVKELKSDIKKQLKTEKEEKATRDLEGELVNEIVDKTKLDMPEALVAEQMESLLREVQQNITYRGMTFQEMLEQEGLTEDQYKSKVIRPEAETRVRTGLVLAEIASEEKIDVTPEELELRMQALKAQYKDEAMQAELEKPETRQSIASRMITEKTVNKLVKDATS